MRCVFNMNFALVEDDTLIIGEQRSSPPTAPAGVVVVPLLAAIPARKSLGLPQFHLRSPALASPPSRQRQSSSPPPPPPNPLPTKSSSPIFPRM